MKTFRYNNNRIGIGPILSYDRDQTITSRTLTIINLVCIFYKNIKREKGGKPNYTSSS